MGTDIHLAVEFYDPETCKWIYVPEIRFSERDYFLFAILADVRNGYILATLCKSFDPVSPIAEPRGLPDDMDKKSLENVNGNHSSSFLSLKEIIEYDWSQTTLKYGYDTLRSYKDFKRTQEPPTCYFEDISGGYIKKMSMEEADKYLEGSYDAATSKNDIYVQLIWPVVFKEHVSESWWKVIEEMKELADDYDNVRIVFNFDS